MSKRRMRQSLLIGVLQANLQSLPKKVILHRTFANNQPKQNAHKKHLDLIL